MTPDTFFASDSLRDLFIEDPQNKATVSIENHIGKFISFRKDKRSCKFELSITNPFELFVKDSVKIEINFVTGGKSVIQYEKIDFQIEQKSNCFIITIEDAP
jgi:hypothetical protein